MHGHYFDGIKNYLSVNNLLEQNEKAVNQLSGYQEWDCSLILDVLQYLGESNCLNQTMLARCLEIALTKPTPEYMWQTTSTELFDREIFRIIGDLKRLKIKIKEEELRKILQLKRKNVKRLKTIISDLNEANLLSEDSVKKALERITEKLSTVTEATVVKKNRDTTGLQRSELILDSKVSVYPEPDKKKQMAGGIATVKKAYSSPDDSTPKYIIKRLDGKLRTPNEGIQEAARREVKYNRSLGRHAELYYKKTPRVLAEWVHGEEVTELRRNPEKLKKTSYEVRIRCLVSGFTELNTFHSHYRVYGDISGRNFIVDLDKATMKLIDFGSSHKRGARKNFETTHHYNDPQYFYNDNDDLHCDLYATGIVITELFPELYSLMLNKGRDRFVPKQIKTTDLSMMDQAIINLVDALMNPEPTHRCSSEDALKYCSKLLNYGDTLTRELLTELEEVTIKRSTTTVEDVLRGLSRGKPAEIKPTPTTMEPQRADNPDNPAATIVDKRQENKDYAAFETFDHQAHQKKLLQLVKDKAQGKSIPLSDENEILDEFANKTTWSGDLIKPFKSLQSEPESQVKLLEMLGQERLVKLIKYSFDLEAVLKSLAPAGQCYLINSLGREHLQQLTSTYGILVKFLLQLESDARLMMLKTLGTDFIIHCFVLPSFLVHAVQQIQSEYNHGALSDLLQVFGNEALLLILQNGGGVDGKPVAYHRFEPWQGVYKDKADLITYLFTLEKLMGEGFSHVLLISGVDAKANTITVSITYNSSDGWTIVNTHLPHQFAITSKSSREVAAQLHSVFDAAGVIELVTQFCVQTHFLEEKYYKFPEKQQAIADRQALNILTSPEYTADEPALMQRVFKANNQSLCKLLIQDGVDFYACGVDQSVTNHAAFNGELFNILCEEQAIYNIKKCKEKIVGTNWHTKFRGAKIYDADHPEGVRVPATVGREWDEITAAQNGDKTYYEAWRTIVELRKDAATHNQDKLKLLSRGKDTQKHYAEAKSETAIPQLKDSPPSAPKKGLNSK